MVDKFPSSRSIAVASGEPRLRDGPGLPSRRQRRRSRPGAGVHVVQPLGAPHGPLPLARSKQGRRRDGRPTPSCPAAAAHLVRLVILACAPRVPVPTGTHGESPALADRSSLPVHGNTSLLTPRVVRSFARRYSDPSAALHQQAQPGPYRTCPRRAGRTPGWPTPAPSPARWVGLARHPADLPEGYHAAPRGQAWQPGRR
jgi:hypothetical protein